MLVKIGVTWYDSTHVPICLRLSEMDKRNIASMAADNPLYCRFPSSLPPKVVAAWAEDKEYKPGG